MHNMCMLSSCNKNVFCFCPCFCNKRSDRSKSGRLCSRNDFAVHTSFNLLWPQRQPPLGYLPQQQGRNSASPGLRPCSFLRATFPTAITCTRTTVLSSACGVLSAHTLAKPPCINESHVPSIPSERIIQFFPRAVFVIACELTQDSTPCSCCCFREPHQIAALIADKDSLPTLTPESTVSVGQSGWTPKAQRRPL